MDSRTLGNLIFMSYRRADVAPQTLAIKLELEAELRSAQVFVDTAIPTGNVWPDELEAALRAAEVIMPVIGKGWAGVGTSGERRIDSPDDWVHRELRFALEIKPQSIFPILVDHTPALSSEDLPVDLRGLAAIQAFRLDTDHWDSSIELLVQVISQKFNLGRKDRAIRYPNPDPVTKKTIPVPWDDLSRMVAEHLPRWHIEFSDDPTQAHYKRVELTATFEFTTFKRAMEFVNLAAQHASDNNHHPRWMNVWRSVTVWLSTWDAGHRVTALDIAFARFLDRKYTALTKG